MSRRDEMAGDSAVSSWFGFDRLRLADEANAVDVTVGSAERWDKAHLRRLRQSADLPGLVPVIDSDTASDGKPYAVTPVVDAPTLADRIPPKGSDWEDCAAITEAAARATHEAHLRGLFHGSLAPDQIYVLADDVAVSGIGLGLGGTPAPAYQHWVAPEVRDGNDATERSDVYSLGKILEASLGASLESVPRSVRRLIMWSSSDTPEARPPSALEFASILAEALGEDRPTFSPAFIPTAEITDLASTASEAVAAYVPSPDSGSGSFPVAGAAATGAAAIGGATVASSILGGDDPAPEPEPVTIDAPIAADQDAGQPAAEAPEEPMTDDGGLAAEAATTAELPGAVTSEIEGPEPAAASDVEPDPGFDARQYGDGILSASDDDDDYEVPAAAQTIDLDESFEAERRGNKAGIVVGAILAAGLGIVAYQLLSSDDGGGTNADAAGTVASTSTTEEVTTTTEAATTTTEAATTTTEATGTDGAASQSSADEDVSTTEQVTTTTEAATTTTEAATTTTEAATTTTEAATTTTEAATTTTEAATTTTEAATTSEAAPTATPLVTGPISSDEAAVQLLHGIPGVDADVYLNGEALAPGFAPGTIAGPADLPPGTYDIAIFAAADPAPASVDDRSDEALIAETMTVGAEPTTLVAHLDADGNPTISAFEEDLSTLAPATSRLEVRHLAAAPPVELFIDDESAGTLDPGQASAVVVDAGEHTIEARLADGTPVKTAELTVADGELASISVIGSAEDDTIAVAVERYTGLSSAPEAVPTGDSNLLAEGQDPTGLYLLAGLASLMAAAGGLVMVRRSRRVL